MPACSSAELEPGPIALLDENIVDTTPEPPVFTPLAKEFSDSLPGFYHALDESVGLLAAESTIDVAGGILDGLGALPATFSSGVNAEALANLQAAEDGFRVARDKAASLGANVPADVQQPAHVKAFNIVVADSTGQRVAGALVTIDADFGSGTTAVTDGRGIATFSVSYSGIIAYTIDAPGHPRASGTIDLAVDLFAHFVTLPPV